jgi:hypothetical protein
MDRADSPLIIQEVQNAADMLIHACRRGRWLRDRSRDSGARLAAELDGIIERYKSLWLSRSRPGGLSDSVRRLERARADYDA